jgi:hypothetical protein
MAWIYEDVECLLWRTPLGVPRRHSCQRLGQCFAHLQTSIETSLDAARTSAYATCYERLKKYRVR